MYNFRVAESHTYFVREQDSTAEPVWVHNACSVTSGNNAAATAGQAIHKEFTELAQAEGYVVKTVLSNGKF